LAVQAYCCTGPTPLLYQATLRGTALTRTDTNVNTPDVTIDNGPATIRFYRPVRFENRNAYLDFYSNGNDVTIDNVTLSESPYDPFDYFTGVYNGKPYFFEMNGTPAKPETVAAAKADAKYNDMAKIVESTRGAWLYND
jgi:hypothetical protein